MNTRMNKNRWMHYKSQQSHTSAPECTDQVMHLYEASRHLHTVIHSFFCCLCLLRTSVMQDSYQQCIRPKKCNLENAGAWSVWFYTAVVSDVYISVSFFFLLSFCLPLLRPCSPGWLVCANPSRNISGWVLDRASARELIPLSAAGGVTQSQPSTHWFTQD